MLHIYNEWKGFSKVSSSSLISSNYDELWILCWCQWNFFYNLHRTVGLLHRLTWDWSKWIMTFRSTGRSLSPPLIAGPAEGSSCGEKQACSHSVHVIIWNFCILSSLMRIILLRKSFTSWSLMPSSSWRPRSGEEGGQCYNLEKGQ